MAARRVLSVLAISVALTLLVPSARAHTQIQRATPGPGAVVEGDVGSVVLDFLDPVTPTPTIEVAGPDGAPVPGLGGTRLTADDVATVDFDPLTRAGEYRVDYSWVAVDGAAQQGAHQFTFEPSTGDDLDVRMLLAWAVRAVLAALLAAAVLGRRRATA